MTTTDCSNDPGLASKFEVFTYTPNGDDGRYHGCETLEEARQMANEFSKAGEKTIEIWNLGELVETTIVEEVE